GSVRVPAQFCGVAGLKPSTGRFPADHRVLGPDDPGPASQILVTDGPLARSVGDLRLAYEVLAGTDPRDPRAVPVPAYGEALPGPVKVAVVADPGGHGVHPAVRGAIETAADALRDAGYDVREVRDVPRMDEALEAYGRITVTEFAPTWPAVRKLLGKGGDRYIEMAMERTPPASADEFMKLMGTWMTIRRSWAEFLDAY
ncbi:amidase family protein, partial [Streptomyces sp. 2MCAF27]